MQSVRFIGPGRSGRSLAGALDRAGWFVDGLLGRSDDLTGAAAGVDVLVITTPDDAVARVAALVRPNPRCVVMHMAASLGLEVLDPHPRRASIHPLVPLPTPQIGAARLSSGVTFAVAGDPVAAEMVQTLGGRPLVVADSDRAVYHAAACVASNHFVALLGQVQRIAESVGLDLEAFLDLTRASLEDVSRLGPAAALTGPVVRGDWDTVGHHFRDLPVAERPGYRAGVELAVRLAQDRAERPDKAERTVQQPPRAAMPAGV